MFRPSSSSSQKIQSGRLPRSSSGSGVLPVGDVALVAARPGYLSEYQLGYRRMTLTRRVRGVGKYWLPLFPQHPLTSKAVGLRMGKGKGSISSWVCRVRRGNVVVSLSGLAPEIATPFLRRLTKKLPFRCLVVKRHRNLYVPSVTLSPQTARS